MIDLITSSIIPGALSLLPRAMDTAPARILLVAIALQESKLLHRAQIGGPARGFWQFEAGGGVRGVLTHPSTRAHAGNLLESMRYARGLSADAGLTAIQHNDILACGFARLLLWTLPGALATTPDEGWRQYLAAWRPGKPHPGTWAGHYATAVNAIHPPETGRAA